MASVPRHIRHVNHVPVPSKAVQLSLQIRQDAVGRRRVARRGRHGVQERHWPATRVPTIGHVDDGVVALAHKAGGFDYNLWGWLNIGFQYEMRERAIHIERIFGFREHIKDGQRVAGLDHAVGGRVGPHSELQACAAGPDASSDAAGEVQISVRSYVRRSTKYSKEHVGAIFARRGRMMMLCAAVIGGAVKRHNYFSA